VPLTPTPYITPREAQADFANCVFLTLDLCARMQQSTGFNQGLCA
jgi:hypothetical protein